MKRQVYQQEVLTLKLNYLDEIRLILFSSVIVEKEIFVKLLRLMRRFTTLDTAHSMFWSFEKLIVEFTGFPRVFCFGCTC